MTIRRALESSHASDYTKTLQNKKLYVTNLPKTNQITEKLVQDLFERYGEVDRVLMVFEGQKRLFRGFCYVIMKNQNDFDHILEMEEKIHLFGHELAIFNSKTIQEVQTTKKIKKNVNLSSSENNRSNQSIIQQENTQVEKGANSKKKNNSNEASKKKDSKKKSKKLKLTASNQRNSDQDTDENRLSPNFNSLSVQQQVNWFNDNRRQPQLNDDNSEHSEYDQFVRTPYQTNLNHLNAASPSYQQGLSQFRGNNSLKRNNNSNYQGFNQGRDYQQQINRNELQNNDFQNQLDNLTGQELVNRHHLLWRPVHLRENSHHHDLRNQTSTPSDSFGFVGPSYSHNNVSSSIENSNDQPVPRIVTNNTSESAAISNYHGGRFNSSYDSSRLLNMPESSELLDSTSERSSRNIPTSQNSLALRQNGMQQGFGPVQLPQGNSMVVQGVDTNIVEFEQATVEIKQTIRTEYKIKKNGIVYIGAINETNIWGSHQHPEF